MITASLKNTKKTTDQAPSLSLVERSALITKIPLASPSITESLTGPLLTQLLDSLATASVATIQTVETLLTQLAQQHPTLVLPYLLQALLHESPKVQSVGAMVLIRLGPSTVTPLRKFHAAHQYHDMLSHSVGFILDQLSAALTPQQVADIQALQPA
jgi:hypothetical protein